MHVCTASGGTVNTQWVWTWISLYHKSKELSMCGICACLPNVTIVLDLACRCFHDIVQPATDNLNTKTN